MTEQWRPIPGYEGLYEVSDQGRVFSHPRPRTRGGILSQRTPANGYPLATISRDAQHRTYEVHRLVALAFLGPRPDKNEVRHLDGDPTNNHLTNLTYGTSSENHLDKVRHGTDHNAVKTHCPKNHPYDDDNTRHSQTKAKPQRVCRACDRERWHKRKAAA